MPSGQQEANLKAKFVTELGQDAFHSGWKSILELDPRFFSAGLSLARVPRQKTNLSPKEQAFVALAVDSAATHLYTPGIHTHIKTALREGASVNEVMEVIELTSTLGIHACNVGVPVLVEVLKEEGRFLEDIARPYDARQLQLKREFTEKRGYWHETWEELLRLDPEFFEAYLEFSGVPWASLDDGKEERKGYLTPKMKELIYCAFDASSTHLYIRGLKLHMRNALGYGATPQDILHVLEIASQLSLQTAYVAGPILQELPGEGDSEAE
ncbi:hypothetical protein NW759_011669 [Fusarium solani]|nr:hypothetical protein NW759_011669 [Fusarium solani]